MPLTSISDEKVVKVVIGVRVLGLEGEDPGVGRRVQLDDGLHRQRPVDEVGRLVVHVLHLHDDALVVGVWKSFQMRFTSHSATQGELSGLLVRLVCPWSAIIAPRQATQREKFPISGELQVDNLAFVSKYLQIKIIRILTTSRGYK